MSQQRFAEQLSKSEDFLLAEFEALQERAISAEDIKSNRVNFFLILVGATLAGFSGLANVSEIGEFYLALVGLGAFVLLLLGLSTLKNLSDYSIAAVILLRRAGRVRRWFVERDPSIQDYVAFPPNDDRPKMFIGDSLLSWRGGEPIIVITNATMVSIIAGVGLSKLLLTEWAVGGAALMFPLAWKAQTWYLKQKLFEIQEWDQKRVNFPSENDVDAK